MIERLAILRAIFRSDRKGDPKAHPAAQPTVRRWLEIGERYPEVRADLLELGGILRTQPFQVVQGVPETEAVHPQVLAYQAGRRDLALQLLALMNLNVFELNTLMMETSDDA